MGRVHGSALCDADSLAMSVRMVRDVDVDGDGTRSEALWGRKSVDVAAY